MEREVTKQPTFVPHNQPYKDTELNKTLKQ